MTDVSSYEQSLSLRSGAFDNAMFAFLLQNARRKRTTDLLSHEENERTPRLKNKPHQVTVSLVLSNRGNDNRITIHHDEDSLHPPPMHLLLTSPSKPYLLPHPTQKSRTTAVITRSRTHIIVHDGLEQQPPRRTRKQRTLEYRRQGNRELKG